MTDQQLTAIALPIDQVHPDPKQPRRLLPRDLADAFASGTPVSEILAQLHARAQKNKWVREKLQKLDGLADSIATDGLYQPIRVIQGQENQYHIEQGERRWWAHHLLLARGDERFREILAFVLSSETSDSTKLRRQVGENIHRSDFTAIELARAMADRINEIIFAEPQLTRREAERRVGKENGMSDRRVRQFLALLTLAPQVQELAQEARVSESSLRSLVGIKEPERQIAVLRHLISAPRKKPRSVARKKNGKKASETARSRRTKRAVNNDKAARQWAVDRIVSLGRTLQGQQYDVLERELRKRVSRKESDRNAIICLRDVIEDGLKQAARKKPARTNRDEESRE
ncbi:MAG: ParB/RepB/Spo0J family partition protein [Chloroflexi bacterium]|nr:ParB/RepB/Spo0J family partition protein [Chloroflexota bacterium]